MKVLLAALSVTLLLAFFGYASWIESLGIAVAVFLATFVSTYSEHKALTYILTLTINLTLIFIPYSYPQRYRQPLTLLSYLSNCPHTHIHTRARAHAHTHSRSHNTLSHIHGLVSTLLTCF